MTETDLAAPDVPPFNPLAGGPLDEVRAELRGVRQGCPVHEIAPGLGFVGRYDLVREALLDAARLSNEGNFVWGAPRFSDSSLACRAPPRARP